MRDLSLHAPWPDVGSIYWCSKSCFSYSRSITRCLEFENGSILTRCRRCSRSVDDGRENNEAGKKPVKAQGLSRSTMNAKHGAHR